ncbi:MAG: valine--tRNA ligase [Alphaproteobacteria bacterium]|nr:MAG: valine--tRNA ligase [Alphaproteobacteria bacterium]
MALDKTFDPKTIEEKHYQDWERSGAFACAPQSDKTPYTIMMPPPNVTGSLHMGHALNTTLQDLLTRYHRMKGYDALWQPGTDHAGIATQMIVERMLDKEGISRKELGREKFLERVWEWKEESGGTIVKQMRAMGATPDWERERFTMDEGLSRAVRKVFVQLYKEKLLYKDKRLVNWDTKLLTSISDLEVESKDQKGKMWHIRYPIEGEVERFITVATTRPETLLGDTAVAVNPDDARYKKLIGKFVSLPLTDRLIPIIADEHADPEAGSGAVKITPAHDFNDYEVGKRHDLPMINILDIHGCLNENTPDAYRGMDRFKARKKILADLEDLDFLVRVDDIQHTVPYGDRSGTIIEPYLTDQWYVDAKTMAKPAIEAVETGKMEFVPKQWENTYFAWMREIQPWCISRQLWWGHQIPAWYDDKGNVYVAETVAEAQAEAGADVKLTQDPDVLDTWFSSALWPFSTLGWPDKTPELDKYYQTDVLLTGFDIIFFWVARMMMMGMHFMDGEVPFKTVYMHALVRDEKGQKMSKSKGNVMDPLDLIEQYGADALRFTMVAMAAQGRDIKMSEDRLGGYRNFATKLWNAARYCEMNDCLDKHEGFDPASVTYTPNKWLIHELATATKEIEKAIDGFKFNEAANAVYGFVWGTYCDWYLEFSKPVLQDGGDAAEEVRQTTSWALEQILTLLNPFMPFITEELYASIAQREEGDRLLTSAWPVYDDALFDDDAVLKMQWLQNIITEIRSVRADMHVPAGAKIDLLVKGACDATKEGFTAFEDVLLRMARLKSISHVEEVPKGSIQTVVGETTLILPIADIIDLDAERERLNKAIGKIDVDIGKIDAKLGNEKFVQNAPEAVIAEQKSRKEDALMKRGKFEKALEQLDC